MRKWRQVFVSPVFVIKKNTIDWVDVNKQQNEAGERKKDYFIDEFFLIEMLLNNISNKKTFYGS
jgi:hypothetical protein